MPHRGVVEGSRCGRLTIGVGDERAAVVTVPSVVRYRRGTMRAVHRRRRSCGEAWLAALGASWDRSVGESSGARHISAADESSVVEQNTLGGAGVS